MQQATEQAEQIALITWVDYMLAQEPRLLLLFHPANGEKRDPRTGALLKRMGVRKGIPDIMFPQPSREYLGLAIEMKVGKNKLTDEQREYLERLRAVGWYTEVCYSWGVAVARICWYLDMPMPQGLRVLLTS